MARRWIYFWETKKNTEGLPLATDIFTKSDKEKLLAIVRKIMHSKGHFLVRVPDADVEFKEWNKIAREDQKMSVLSAPRIVARHEKHMRNVRAVGKETRRGQYMCYAHLNIVFRRAHTNKKPIDWTGHAAKVGMIAYGTNYTKKGMCLQDEKGNALRDEVEMREFMIFMAWFCKPGGFGVDCFAGSCVSGLAALRMGIFWCCIEKDKKIVGQSQTRLEQYYMFLKHQDLLPIMGLAPPPPRDWEVAGTHWVRKAAEVYNQIRARTTVKKENAKKLNKQKIDILGKVHKDVQLAAGRRGLLPPSLPTNNYVHKEQVVLLNDPSTYSSEVQARLEAYTKAYADDNEEFWELNELANGLRLREDKDGMLGLETVRNVKDGAVITYFKGKLSPRPSIISDKVIYLSVTSDKCGKPIYMICEGDEWCAASMVNDGVHGEKGKVNCAIVENKMGKGWKPDISLVRLVATTDIDVTEGPVELLVDYDVGDGEPTYWKNDEVNCWFPGCDRADSDTMVHCQSSSCVAVAHEECVHWDDGNGVYVLTFVL